MPTRVETEGMPPKPSAAAPSAVVKPHVRSSRRSAFEMSAFRPRDRFGRNAECLVLRALTIRRDAVWPKAASPLRRRSAGKADGPLPTQLSHSAALARFSKADASPTERYRKLPWFALYGAHRP